METPSSVEDAVLPPPALAAPQLGALQQFSCGKVTSTSPWQRSPAKWTPGSGERALHTHTHTGAHASQNTHGGARKHALVKVTMLRATKGQMVDSDAVPALAGCLEKKKREKVHFCCVSSWICPDCFVFIYFSVVFIQSRINFSNKCVCD